LTKKPIFYKFSGTMKSVELTGKHLNLTIISTFLAEQGPVSLAPGVRKQVQAARDLVLKNIREHQVVYGINTGFGKLAQVQISGDDLDTLQLNLLRSHACGVGEPIDTELVVLMMLLKVNNLAAGYSGCSMEVVEKLLELLNKRIIPVVPRRGSVGASGDLAPLSHMSLPLIGEGDVFYNGERQASQRLVAEGIYEPVRLGPKDGLSLINGTQYSTTLIAFAVLEAAKIVLLSELAVAMSVEAELATDVPFRPEIHKLRRQKGQITTAKHLLSFLRDSEIVKSHLHCKKVQDPYSFRCAPQVLGVSRDALRFAEDIVENELNAVTDNPLVFAGQGEILSAGNFHAEPLAFAGDQLCIALTELGNISERRIANLTDSAMSNLPAFLVTASGVNSGFMIAHVTAAALCAENRTLSNPASVQNIPTSANQEDHVSMAPNAGLKLLQVIRNLKTIVWIELLVAAQGMDFRKPRKGGRATQRGYDRIREMVDFLSHDRVMYPDLAKADELFSDQLFISEISAIADQES